MNIPSKYAFTGAEAPEGTTMVTCGLCEGKFAVPNDEVASITDTEVSLNDEETVKIHICEDCVEMADKLNAAAAAVEMKDDVSDELKRALGE